MEKSVLELIGGEKRINPHYDIKAESTSCYLDNKGFTGIEINGVRFSNIGEMLRYMDRQREQLIKAKDLLLRLSTCLEGHTNNNFEYELLKETAQFLNSEVEK